MSQYFNQMRGDNDAKRLLEERLAREEMGNAAYDKMISNHDDRTFKIVGAVLMVVFGVAVFVVTGLEY
ncbi:hypothetical protein [Rhizobium sp. Leaf453]|uniref:hypothetical protein n=1 Tax=Rhizobium sp. Leaf453 TaxID=1736380 RepID=UPI000A68B874|nr:hypothetical protein [Rhizobium sp. Leaf453]